MQLESNPNAVLTAALKEKVGNISIEAPAEEKPAEDKPNENQESQSSESEEKPVEEKPLAEDDNQGGK